jgi:hypothetical protein
MDLYSITNFLRCFFEYITCITMKDELKQLNIGDRLSNEEDINAILNLSATAVQLLRRYNESYL